MLGPFEAFCIRPWPNQTKLTSFALILLATVLVVVVVVVVE